MAKIRVLPKILVNKIAAGEVVERPASVVKELVENAIDAQAGHIEITIEEGGKQLIKVSDDGVGIAADELPLAVAPHATSKLASEDDLFRIGTLGFRGEALASIAAVSHVRVVSRVPEAEAGAEIRAAGEQIDRCVAAGCPVGTTVEVRDLFFNVPARRKFLRTNATENSHIAEQFTRLVLAHPQLGFELAQGSRIVHRLAGDQRIADRLVALFGPELAEDLLTVRRQERGVELECYLAPPARSRATSGGQYIFVNGRFVKDRVISYAIREAYRGLIEQARYPVVFLFISLDPAEVDVNVHPTKIEVRWADSGLIRSQVLSALRETLQRGDLTPTLQTIGPGLAMTEQTRDQIRQQAADEFKRLASVASGGGGAESWSRGLGERSMGRSGGGGGGGGSSEAGPMPARSPSIAESGALWRSLYSSPQLVSDSDVVAPTAPPSLQQQQHGEVPLVEPPPEPTPAVGRGSWHRSRAIQLHNTYLVAETPDGLVIIDQHALHERILYEQLRRRLTQGRLESQQLLLPETLELTGAQIAVLEDRQELLDRLGIEVNAFGPTAVAVQRFPSLLVDADVRGFMRDLVDKLVEHDQEPETEAFIHRLIEMMACKAAVKAGDSLTPAEIDKLLADRDLVDKASNCPHGRPTALRMGLKDLERQFKRT